MYLSTQGYVMTGSGYEEGSGAPHMIRTRFFRSWQRAKQDADAYMCGGVLTWVDKDTRMYGTGKRSNGSGYTVIEFCIEPIKFFEDS